ncbi:hypothetical protein [Streptomyces cylindrosporus]|uniref:ATP-binding protein n=1 Tax=Streptomyces cylindrosporus TaxID=2927583 RepID=A0ABS9Y5R6_9ACTN|nr:hypothetical protein [Streptomyces cylindrosporus]MCI3272554.1 hypothetical protein [Streptomyces cylindrosporus]
MLHFDEADRLDFIEATAASGLSFTGIQLSGRPFGEVLDELCSNSIDFALDDSGCVLTGYGIELYTPAPGELDIDVEGVALRSPVEGGGSSGASEIAIHPPASEDTLFSGRQLLDLCDEYSNEMTLALTAFPVD